MTLSRLSHVVGLVTGGASGLGSATASTLVRAGARVVVADLPHQYERFQELERRLSMHTDTHVHQHDNHKYKYAQSHSIAFVGTDVTSEDQVNKALDLVEELYGEPGTVPWYAYVIPCQSQISTTPQNWHGEQYHPYRCTRALWTWCNISYIYMHTSTCPSQFANTLRSPFFNS